MRKYFILFLAVNVTSLYALIGGAGINIIQDQFMIEDDTATFADVNIFTTSEINNPVGVGGFIYLTIIPFIDFEAGYNATYASYKFGYPGLVEQEFGIAKATWYTSAQYPFFSPPTMRFYIGVGGNGTDWLEPITYDTLETLDEEGKEFDDTDAILEAISKSSSGYHFELGARFKPPLFPMSLNANARYIMDKDFHSDIDGYLMVSLGVAFAI
jgi:hypothetical protein